MTNIRNLIAEMAAQEARCRATRFVAPCVRGGRVRTKVAGLIATFTPNPADFEGWGRFQVTGAATAQVMETADLPLVTAYLQAFPPLRLRLARLLQGRTWLAYPVNESDAWQRLGAAKPLPVHLVTEGAAFEQIVARWDGAACWFEEVDRRAAPQIAEALRESLRQGTLPEALRFANLTPEARTVYALATPQTGASAAQKPFEQAEARLRSALRLGGGALRDYQDRGEFWLVEWTTRDGARHSSAIAKRDLTVISAGICLSERDRDFDLQSLVGVVEGRDW